MKQTTFLSEEQLIRKAVHVLMDRLGPVETMRFLRLKAGRRLDSVTRHRRWQQGLDRDSFLREIFPGAR